MIYCSLEGESSVLDLIVLQAERVEALASEPAPFRHAGVGSSLVLSLGLALT